METENYVMSLIDSMDCLWFHQIILSPQPSKTPLPSSEFSSKIEPAQEDENSSQESEDLERQNLGKTESFSSSLSQKKSRNTPRLRKSVSCKSLIELEIEEVRGFVDLGFNFRRENLSNHIISLLPGLQRIDKFEEINADDEEKTRPYLSESWIIRKPDSPLLNLRMPTLCSAEDMKKHLKFWAQTVASDVQDS